MVFVRTSLPTSALALRSILHFVCAYVWLVSSLIRTLAPFRFALVASCFVIGGTLTPSAAIKFNYCAPLPLRTFEVVIALRMLALRSALCSHFECSL